jgi:hypothetical protein
MNARETPFTTIESAYEFLTLMTEAMHDTRRDIEAEVLRAGAAPRRREAFQLVAYKLDKLAYHVSRSRTLLNDLRTLRRLLYGERAHTNPSPAVPRKAPARARRSAPR